MSLFAAISGSVAGMRLQPLVLLFSHHSMCTLGRQQPSPDGFSSQLEPTVGSTVKSSSLQMHVGSLYPLKDGGWVCQMYVTLSKTGDGSVKCMSPSQRRGMGLSNVCHPLKDGGWVCQMYVTLSKTGDGSVKCMSPSQRRGMGLSNVCHPLKDGGWVCQMYVTLSKTGDGSVKCMSPSQRQGDRSGPPAL